MTKVKDLSNSVTPTGPTKILRAEEAKIPDYLREEAQKELKLVKGRFRLYEKGREGGSEKVTFRKYPAAICPMFIKTMRDGEVYEIPLYAARFINGYDSCAKAINGKINSCGVAKHGFKMSHPDDLKRGELMASESGETVAPSFTDVSHYERRMGFESLEFSENIG